MTVEVTQHEQTPLWRNATFLKWLAQILTLLAVVAFFVILGSQAVENFNRSGISFSFDWLTDPTGVDIREGIDTSPNSGARALAVGIVNTLRVTISGIFAASILGIIIGIARLSNNWIVGKVSTLYIETIRNIPLLVQMFFWSAVAITLPDLTSDDLGEYWFKLSNRGFAFAWIFPSGGFWPWLTIVIAGVFVGRYVARWQRRIQEGTGRRTYPITGWFLTVVVFGVIGWFAWPLLGFLSPVFHGIASFIDAVPAIVFVILIALAAIGGAAWWIRSFFESRRTPAGFGKITDDDWFRVIFAGVSGIAIAGLAFVIGGITIELVGGEMATVAELLRTLISNVFDWLGRSFDPSLQVGAPLDPQKAEVVVRGAGFVNYGTSGQVVSVPFFAVWFGVTLYTAAFIAEIVRGGVLAVPKGQTEASEAVGLTRSQLLRLIILPQAFRIIMPPMGNQYLNLFKNTSLGIGVAYADIVAVGITILNQTGQSLPVVLVWMAFFLTGSLLISAIVNYYNRRMMLVER